MNSSLHLSNNLEKKTMMDSMIGSLLLGDGDPLDPIKDLTVDIADLIITTILAMEAEEHTGTTEEEEVIFDTVGRLVD